MAGVVRRSLPWGFRAWGPTKAHDGDSFWMMCDSGFGQRYEPELRLDGVHAPEIRPLQPGGAETAAFVNGWLAARSTVTRRWPFWVEIIMETTFEPDMVQTFTRYVGTVWPYDRRGDPDGSLNAAVRLFLADHPEWGGGS